MKIQKHIEIVRSSISGLSSMGEKSAEGIYNLLRRSYASVRISIINDFEDLEALVQRHPDLVFIGMKFVPTDPSRGIWDSPKIWLTEYLEDQGIAFTGSDHFAHNLELDKSLAKQRILSSGLSTSPFTVIPQDQAGQALRHGLSYPLFVKPTNRGGGWGIDSNSVVHTEQSLNVQTTLLANRYNADSLVEEYLPGREFSVAILKEVDEDGYKVMPLELIAPLDTRGNRILSAAIKVADTERFEPVTDITLHTKITSLAIQAFHALGAQDYGRIDIRLNQYEEPQFLEANLIPSLLKDYGNFPKACMLNEGMDYATVILQIVRLGLKRTEGVVSELPVLSPLPAAA